MIGRYWVVNEGRQWVNERGREREMGGGKGDSK